MLAPLLLIDNDIGHRVGLGRRLQSLWSGCAVCYTRLTVIVVLAGLKRHLCTVVTTTDYWHHT